MGRSTFNGRDHEREIVGTCQPFPANISVTEHDSKGFEVDFIRDQGCRIKIFFRSSCMYVTKNNQKQSLTQNAKPYEKKHKTQNTPNEKHREKTNTHDNTNISYSNKQQMRCLTSSKREQDRRLRMFCSSRRGLFAFSAAFIKRSLGFLSPCCWRRR